MAKFKKISMKKELVWQMFRKGKDHRKSKEESTRDDSVECGTFHSKCSSLPSVCHSLCQTLYNLTRKYLISLKIQTKHLSDWKGIQWICMSLIHTILAAGYHLFNFMFLLFFDIIIIIRCLPLFSCSLFNLKT